ncbi:hypothetical protein EV426DRAFT_719819 [Tirmania nivea]|nr:hypothetical protein EV426DRAFT_719819 [Tirmania nivea]
MASSTSLDQAPKTPQKQKLHGDKDPENISPCPSASTSGPSFYDSTPTTPPSGSVNRNDTTIAGRRGKTIGPLVDSMLLDHPIYGYTRNAQANFINGNAPGAIITEDDNVVSHHDNDAKTPKPKQGADMDSAESTSSEVFEATTPSEEDLGRRGLPSACVFVANLAATRTDEELQKSLQNHFGKIGRLHVKIRRDEKGNPYSFCQFENDEDARRAIREGRGQVVDGSGRRIRCEPAKVNRTLLLAKLDNGIFDEKETRKALFGFGQLESLDFISGKYAAARGIRNGCFLRFVYRQDAVDCHQYFRSHNVWSVEWANNAPAGSHLPANDHNSSIDPFSVFVGQLNADKITKEVLLERFGKYGNIVDCNLVIKPGKFGLGKNAFAFVKYDDQYSATHAIDSENNCPFLGKVIHVQRREFHDKHPRIGVHGNQYRQFHIPMADGHNVNANVPGHPHAISFSVADVADLAARLTLNYASQGNFNTRQAGLDPRAFNMQQNSAAPPAVIFPFYPQFLYGGHTAASASPRTAKNANGVQDHPYIAGYYPHVEGHAGQPVPNPELLHPPFGAPYDGHYNPYHMHYGGQSSGIPQNQEQFHTAGYGSEQYENSHDTSVASQGGIQA